MDVGVISYKVEAKTEALVRGQREALDSVDRLEKGMQKSDVQMKKTSAAIKDIGNESSASANKLKALTRIFGGLLTLRTAKGLIEMAEGYNEMAERIEMATSSSEEYELVQKRLITTANGTYRALSEAQEIYIQTADSLRSLGYSTEQVLDITDSLSYAFVKNATSTARADSAMSAYTKAVNKGKVEVNGWESILAAVPSIVTDIANASGHSAKEIREMGFSGDLTARMLNEGLRTSLESNKEAADGMAATLRDAFTNLRTNLSAYIGEANRSTGATQLMADAVGALADNIDSIVKVLTVAGTAALTKYSLQLADTVRVKVLATLEAQKQARAELALAQANAAQAATAAEGARSTAGLTTSHSAAAAAADRQAAANVRLDVAQKAVATSARGLLAVLGGPIGVISLLAAAAAGVALFGSNSKTAKSEVDLLSASINDLGDANLRLMRTNLMDAVNEMEGLSGSAQKATNKLKYFQDQLKEKPTSTLVPYWIRQVERLEAGLETSSEELEKYKARIKEVDDELKKRRGVSGVIEEDRDPEVEKELVKLRERLELVKLEGSARARLQAIQALGSKATKEEIAEAEALATKIYEIENARKELGKTTKENTKYQEENRKVIKDLEQALIEAALSGDALAQAKAEAKLNEFATPEDVALVRQLAAELYELDKIAELRKKVGDDPNKYVRGNVDPLSGGPFDDQSARFEAERQKEEERYADQLARLQESLDAKAILYEDSNAIIEQLNVEHAERLNQIDQAQRSVMLSTASTAFGALADLVKNAQGEQSSAYKAMFAISKAFAIADAGIKLNMAIMQAMADPTALSPWQKLANYAMIASAGAGVLNAISGTNFGGGRFYGGGVNPDSMYRINEGGAPEVLNTGDGKQYLLPNSRGEVVSNSNAKGGGAVMPKVEINLIESQDNGGTVNMRQDEERIIADITVSQIRNNSEIAQAIQETYGVQRQGT